MAAPLTATQMGEQIERGPALQSAEREVSTVSLGKSSLQIGSRFLSRRQSLLPGKSEIGIKKQTNKQTNKPTFRVLCIGDNVGTGARPYGGNIAS